MAVGERQRRKMPSFSSSLLDAIYHSIDEQPQRRNVDDEIESLRRAIMVEKWMEKYTHTTATATATARPETDSSSTLKKVKEPVSPAARIANFFNSIFSPRKGHSVRKSRSTKDTARSCLVNKSKRCVRFCPLVHQDSLIYNNNNNNNIERDLDDKSCASSDLFELQNIDELPVYGTTDLQINRAIATAGFNMY